MDLMIDTVLLVQQKLVPPSIAWSNARFADAIGVGLRNRSCEQAGSYRD
jgi:hypothetical protein